MKKTGRNDPCPCGSGKKYKKCCMSREKPEVANLTWPKMRRTEGELITRLLRHVEKYYGPEAIQEAWDDFTVDKDLPMDFETEPELDTIFIPWFVFNWMPDNTGVDEAEHYPEMPVAEHYLEKFGKRLDPFQRRFIEEAVSQPYSFFQVKDFVPGESMRLRDIFLDREVTVLERQASKVVRKGSILFTRIITMNETSIMLGTAPTLIPSSWFYELIDMREGLREEFPQLDQDLLHVFDKVMRTLYYDIREVIDNPPAPVMQNSDGDALQFTKLYYTLQCSPQAALEALASLSLSDADTCRESGVFDEKGELISIRFPWLREGNKQLGPDRNTVLGHIEIDGDQLTIDVNSQQRAETIRDEVTRRLGERAVFRNARIESTEKMLEERQNMPESERAAQARQTSEELMELPEVQQELRNIAREYWNEWLDKPIPILAGQTPREAAKTPLGRERLEEFFLDYENRSGIPEPFKQDIGAIRKKLGLE